MRFIDILRSFDLMRVSLTIGLNMPEWKLKKKHIAYRQY